MRRGFLSLIARARRRGPKLGDEQPLRGELFNTNQLEQLAKELASQHEVDWRGGPDWLLDRLSENEPVLLEAYQLVVKDVSEQRRMTPADEWLLDNFYIIEEQIRTTRRHLPKTYSRELPHLLHGPSAGFPRVYAIALELISHVDGRVSTESLTHYVRSYQAVAPLTLGELWAIPIMLRLALIENLRRVAVRLTAVRMRRDEAHVWANRMLEADQHDPQSVVLVMAAMARVAPAMTSEFAAEFARRLQGNSEAMALPLMWLEQRLAEQAVTIEELLQIEGQQQAADQVSIGNSINSLRMLGAMDWRNFVESLSLVEQTLRGFPRSQFGAEAIGEREIRDAIPSVKTYDDVYSEMDFGTRDRYRHVIERIAKRSPLAEWDVAARAIELTRSAADLKGHRDRSAHVGYFLVDQGLPQLEAAAQARIPIAQRVRRWVQRHPLFTYLGAIGSITAALTAITFIQLVHFGVPPGYVVPLAILLMLGISQLSVSVVNWLVTLLVAPEALPRMDLSEGIPSEYRTLVAVPTLLTSLQDINDLVEALEIRYLANRDTHIHFSLVTDWRDAPQETMPGDDLLLQHVRDGIEALNEKYKLDRNDIFFLFHRPRRWNPQERIWMGYERKRGKLADLNACLRTGKSDSFALIVGEIASLRVVRYVITLDSDTQLPRDAARELVATMVHPLNRPKLDRQARIVGEGYSILQPRVGLSFPSARRSWFVRLFGGQAGIDPYTRTVSDVYQDLFREGSFIGKGIYDVDAFEQVLHGRFPENLILSHDLIEGCHARCALVSDVELFEAYPSRYISDAIRRHRWIRGDWQIAMWVLPRVPAPDGTWVNNPLSAVARWKILDNLRRSLVPWALVLLLILVWTIPIGPAWIWTMVLLAIMILPVGLRVLVELAKRPTDVPWVLHVRGVLQSLGRYTAQALCALVFLVDEAYYSADAVVRTLVRLAITRRNLLQWSTSTDAERSARTDLLGVMRAMWFSPALAILLGILLALMRRDSLPPAGGFVIAWLLAPVIAWWLSHPLAVRDGRLQPADTEFLEQLARKTWRFFETFIGPEDNWLPPDNYQEYPVAVIAHRTSPTNMGLTLLSNLAAHDFGFISTGQLEERTEKALEAMERLERFHGHFFNWYDTRALEPLHPRYVSTVDSGNLIGHLLTLRIGLLQLADKRILPSDAWRGLAITLRVLTSVVRWAEHTDSRAGQGVEDLSELAGVAEQMERDLLHPPSTLVDAARLLAHLAGTGEPALVALRGHRNEQVRWWAFALARQAQAWLDEVNLLAPLAGLPPAPISGAPREHESLADLQVMLGRFEGHVTLRGVAQFSAEFNGTLDRAAESAGDLRDWLTQLKQRVDAASGVAMMRIALHEKLARMCLELSDAEFDFLYDKPQHLLAIGFSAVDRRLDSSFYDLLASEARLASFVAIAEGRLRQEHWFALGRLLTRFGGETTLLSWSGSMFEYLMPLLVMPSLQGTLLDRACKVAVARQIAYGASRKVPWGISESGYNVTDIHLNYQYRAFGVPGLGLKRGLADDLVIAPYASLMALMVAPIPACANLRRLVAEGFEGRYGFYEAIDYTPSRLPRSQSFAVVRSFMTHHQAMGFLSLANVLLERAMQRRFEEYPPFQATDLLLQERIPKALPIFPHTAEVSGAPRPAIERESLMRVFRSPNTPTPEVQLLSNGRYHVVITNAGGGYSRWKDLAVTRWHEDVARDNYGMFCYLRDVTSNDTWSAGFQPTLKASAAYEAIFLQSRAEFRRRDADIDTHTEVTVSPEDDVELRRVRITNVSRFQRTIELTSYAEVVLTSPAADATHPAFSNLFVQTEILHNSQAILCTRRPRSGSEHPPWMFHLMSLHGTAAGPTSYETDRARFLGRCQDVASPRVMSRPEPLSNSEGSVLDPIVAIRCAVSLEPGEAAVVDIVSGISELRETALGLVEKYRDRQLADRVLDLAWTHGQVILQQLNVTESEAQMYGRLASSIIYASGLRRATASVLAKNLRGQSGLWGHGISGDYPIVLLRIAEQSKVELVRHLVQAHAYWRFKGLTVDLVIWNEDQSGYRQYLHDKILSLIGASTEANLLDRPGGIFVRRPEQMSEEDRILMQSVARVVMTDTGGMFVDQIERRGRLEVSVPSFAPTRSRRAELPAVHAQVPARRELMYANGLGGFSPDGREYVITLQPNQRTPAPWVNVLANPRFGAIVTESGGGYTWMENAHEFRLTPWYNDPVTDRSGELFYLRDEETGRFWSPTPRPTPGQNAYTVRHGFGYSVFETWEGGMASELTVYVASDAPVKFFSLKLRNISERARRVSATCCFEWVLADMRSKSLMHLVTETDPPTGALLVRNPYSADFPGYVAFLDVNRSQRTITGDRMEFIGRNGTVASPAAMTRARLSGKVGVGLDPCGAMQTHVDMAPGQEQEIIFLLGTGMDIVEARDLIQRFRGAENSARALKVARKYWQKTLDTIVVETPDLGINTLVNGWLLYQTLASRLWARSGFYQSAGAFGFRDQLQDIMALSHTVPGLMREHLLRAAAHQFVEGDVQHWWHPPTGRGVRTHFSDDYLWLPLATCHYVKQIGDSSVLDERIHFLQGRPVNPDEEAYYDLPVQSEESAPLYEHCVRAIEHGLRFGGHGLPLMGCGDWNDGMNRVGHNGKGESVWLAFFLFHVLQEFIPIAAGRGDTVFAEKCQAVAAQLQQNIESHAWDGGWYVRAFFDNGEPLGSASNQECQIDSLPQSWSVLSQAGDPHRAQMAMDAVDQRLMRREHGLIQLFDPPFDKSPLDPGYIKGYVPGVRENGGQYTHAAIWTVIALATLGDRRRAWELMSLINPLNHGSTPEGIAIYKVEPYVVAADVYAVAPHTGRGGWTWYTGSAGWMYQLLVHWLFGLRLEVDTLRFVPCLPEEWRSLQVRYRYRETMYHITLKNRGGLTATRVVVDGAEQPDRAVHLVNDHREHSVEVEIEKAEEKQASGGLAPPG